MNVERTTIYTLSKIANVSPSTISKALKNSPEISAEVRSSIRALAQKHNFRPRVMRKKNGCIGVLLQQYPSQPIDFGFYLSAIVEGIAEYCHDEGISPAIISGPPEEFNAYDPIKEFARRDVDGIVAVRCNQDSHYLEILEKNNFPYCVINADSPDMKYKTITANFYSIGRKAALYLAEQGHRQVGLLLSPPDGLAGAGRAAGFLSVPELNVTIVRSSELPALLQEGFQCGRLATRILLERNPALTAIFATGAEPAIGALKELSQMNIPVPQRMSVISCDDYPIMECFIPAITTVAVPLKPLGYAAAKQVHRLMRGLMPFELTHLAEVDGNLIIRDSVGAVNSQEEPRQNRHEP